CTRGDWYFDVW
nr:immunoglobulin heavy chain junction region [Mus musculus]MBK4198396.1 immunoglobulin heavy chain junction region [Mus musculus]